MKNLGALNKYFIKYKWRLLSGILFVAISSWFGVRTANVVEEIIDNVQKMIGDGKTPGSQISSYVFIQSMVILGLGLLRGLFMFFQRQTLIVMSRHIEYDQKNEIYNHYQQLNTVFIKHTLQEI